jgi:PBSX family phage terminase large subunit
MTDYSNLRPLSPKARASIKSDGWMTVWEGAIRSGKTVASLIAWLMYLQNTNEKVFFMSGKTYGSLIRNVIDGDFGILALGHPFIEITKDRTGSSVLLLGDKKVYLFGASDDGAYMRLKGLTAGGWYADEVATHPESFIVEALARTAVSSDRRIFWTLNPTFPSHYIYSKFMDRWEGTEGYRRFHFTLEDNYAMTPERRRQLAEQYTGRYKSIYILGLRVAATGAIYDNFDRATVVFNTAEENLEDCMKYIVCDYGTINPCVFLECTISQTGIIYVLREYRWDSRVKLSQKTDAEYVQDMIKFAGRPDSCDSVIVVDPSASSFIIALQHEGFFVKPANNDVLNGIMKVSSLIAQNRLRIHESCTGLISEMEGYSWDEKSVNSGVEKPLKVRDHGPDALRYYVNTCLSNFEVMQSVEL